MDVLDSREKFWGGIFGIIAILASIAEMIINGVNAASVVGAVKDIAGTLVVVVLLVTFLKNMPHKPKNLTEMIECAIETWGEDNAPLIFKTEGYVRAQNSECSQGFVLLQNPRNYIALANNKLEKNSTDWHKYAQYGNGKLTGKFLDMPSYEAMTKASFEIMIVMGQSHFANMPEIDTIINSLVSAFNSKHMEGMSASCVGKSRQIKLSCNKIETDHDVKHLVEALDFVLSMIKVIA